MQQGHFFVQRRIVPHAILQGGQRFGGVGGAHARFRLQIEAIHGQAVQVNGGAVAQYRGAQVARCGYVLAEKCFAQQERLFAADEMVANEAAGGVGVGRQRLTQRSEKPMDVLRGHFAGIDLGGGYYDIEPEHKGYQGEFLMVGAEYGYAFALAPRWRLDAYVGVGWLGTQFRYYEGTSDDVHLIYQHDGKLNWFGPVKAGVSIKYLFTHKVRRRRR